jgi:hypothetical protein
MKTKWLVKYRYDGPVFLTVQIEAERVTAVPVDVGSSMWSYVDITADHVTFRVLADNNADVTVEKKG